MGGSSDTLPTQALPEPARPVKSRVREAAVSGGPQQVGGHAGDHGYLLEGDRRCGNGPQTWLVEPLFYKF